MRLKKAKIVIIIALTLLIATAGKAFGLTRTAGVGSIPTINGEYCVQHEGTLSPSVDYGEVKGHPISYGGGSAEPADLMVAYALYLGLEGAELQHVIWASSNNTGEKESLNNDRIAEYIEIHDNIFAKSDNVLTGTKKNDNLKVLVDRTNGTYTVGPYKIDLAVSGVSSALKAKLLKEIRTGVKGTGGAYAAFSGIEGVNGTILDLVYSDGSKIKSENGLSYGFPDFGRDFYIKFKPKYDGAINYTGNPSFKVEFLKNVTGTVYRHQGNDVEVVVKYSEKDFKAKAKFDSPSQTLNYDWKEEDPATWEKTVQQKTTVKLTNNLKHHNGNVIAKIEDIEVTLVRTLRYRKGQLVSIGNVSMEGELPTETIRHVKVTPGHYTKSIQDMAYVEGGEQVWTEEDNPELELTPSEEEEYTYEGEFTGGLRMPGAPIDMQIGGRVWLEAVEPKTGDYNGRYKATDSDNDKPFAGIQVELYQSDGTLVATTTTDKDGRYRFYGSKKILDDGGELKINGRQHFELLINPLKQYYVVFEYDGQRYQATYYRNDISKPGGFSNAREVGRETYNAKFKEIYSGNANYQTTQSTSNPGASGTALVWRRAYSTDHKIAKDDGTYATTGEKNEEGKDIALTYEDVYKKFLELATSNEVGQPKANDNCKVWQSRSYAEILSDSGELKTWLEGKGVKNEFDSIKKFIMDSLMKSSTQKDQDGNTILYPKYDKFVVKELYNTNSSDYKSATTKTIKVGNTYTYLYSINYDMARYVDFGLCNRLKADIRLQKDVYKTTLIVNGKKEEYKYAERDLSANPNNNNWDIRVRAADNLYNGTTSYNRDVRASEYLLGEENVGANRVLQAYVTYRIAFKNVGDVDVKVKEIVDYYDADGYTYDGNNKFISDNTFIGDYDAKKTKDLTVSTTGLKDRTRSADNKLKADGYNYEELYLTGMDSLLTPGNVSWVYVTFKVNNDDKGKIKLDYDKDPYTTSAEEINNAIGIGKQNIAEINAYETYYRGDSRKTEIPNYLKPVKDNNGKIKDYELVKTDVSGKVAGLIDNDSNPGNLSRLDLDANGNLIVEKTTKKIEGKAGIVASDRQEDDTSQAPNIRLIIDNDESEIRRLQGYVFDDKRTENNETTGNATIGNGKYDDEEEKVNGVRVQLVEIVSDVDEIGVSKHNYAYQEKIWESYTYDPNTNELSQTDDSRYSSGDGKTKIIINGPKGTIFEVKDNEKLALNDGNYVLKSLPAGDFYIRFVYGDDYGTVLTNDANSDVNKVVGLTGRNAKSYNGQDYKSTVYQKDIDQSGEYHGITGYTNYLGQNYTLANNVLNNGTDVKSMYYYNISASKASNNVSDAKDVGHYRVRSNNFSKGADGSTLLNKRAEVLASFEKLSSYAPSSDPIINGGDNASYGYDGNGGKVYDYFNNEYYKQQQKSMIDQFRENTYVVSQTGIINTEIEMDRNESQYDLEQKDTKTLNYTIDNINFGLTERPKAQLKLNKEVENYNLTLQNGQVLFDTVQSVNNLSFSGHVQHTAEKENGLFKADQPRVGRPGNGNSEIIQNYVDNEMLYNATVNIIYKLTVENVSETDYKDEEFYYTGKETNKSENISKTSAVKVVDYVSNTIKFDKAVQNQWNTTSYDDLVPSKDASEEDKNLVNRLYYPELETYDTILTTDTLGGELEPGQKKETKLTLATQTSANNNDNNLVYNNMAEIIATSNDVGRRCVYSIPGNEEMADQSLKNDAAEYAKSPLRRLQVAEIDADSSQEIRLLPPTGEEIDNTKYSIGLTFLLSISLASVAAIKNLLNK